MTNTPTVAFRLPEEMIERLDLYAHRLSAQTGLVVNRTDVIRKLLTEGLDRVQPDNVRDAAMDARDRARMKEKQELARQRHSTAIPNTRPRRR